MLWPLLLLLLFSCAAPYYRQSADLMREGQFDAACLPLAKADLPYTDSNEAPLLLLSRAMVHFQQGNDFSAAQDFEKALDAIDYYSQTSSPEVAGQLLVHDGLGAYLPPPFEIGLARFYQALAFLHQDLEDSAAATLYYLENHSGQNPLTTYLLANLLEKRGDVSNARILYSRLLLNPSKPSLLIIYHRGKAPVKFSETAPISIVSSALVEKLLQSHNIRPAISSLSGIPVPVLTHHYLPRQAPLFLNDQTVLPTLTYDVAKAAKDSLENEMPLIAAKAAARLLIRRGIIASTQEHYQPLVDAAVLIANVATRADTRSWASLPAQIDLYALDLAPGEHLLRAGNQEVILSIPPKKIVVVEVFQPSSDNACLRYP
jgi:uncharacterized protein